MRLPRLLLFTFQSVLEQDIGFQITADTESATVLLMVRTETYRHLLPSVSIGYAV